MKTTGHVLGVIARVDATMSMDAVDAMEQNLQGRIGEQFTVGRLVKIERKGGALWGHFEYDAQGYGKQ